MLCVEKFELELNLNVTQWYCPLTEVTETGDGRVAETDTILQETVPSNDFETVVLSFQSYTMLPLNNANVQKSYSMHLQIYNKLHTAQILHQYQILFCIWTVPDIHAYSIMSSQGERERQRQRERETERERERERLKYIFHLMYCRV